LGYGVVGTNLAFELAKVCDLSLFPIKNAEVPQDKSEILRKAFENSFEFDRSAPSLKIWHEHDLASSIGSPVCAFPIFELNNFNRLELHHLRSVDHLFVCSKWAKQVCKQRGVNYSVVDSDNKSHNKGPEIHICPLGVDRSIFHTDIAPSLSFAQSPVFLNVGKWEYRKGHDILVEAFNRAFSPSDDVILLMCCDNTLTHITDIPFGKAPGTYQKEWEELYQYSEMGLAGKIKFVPRVETQQELASLMMSADCGVFPARAEGWNLELLEMMSCGKHVITTNYGGHTEFCNEENSVFIEDDGMEDGKDGIFFGEQRKGEWLCLGERAINSLAEYMKCFHKDNIKASINTSGILTAKEFSWARSRDCILEVLCQ